MDLGDIDDNSVDMQQDVHPKITQDRLGHAGIRLATNTYSNVFPGVHVEPAINGRLTYSDCSEQ